MASKLTDTELTVGTDGHKVTGVDADGKALTSGSVLLGTASKPFANVWASNLNNVAVTDSNNESLAVSGASSIVGALNQINRDLDNVPSITKGETPNGYLKIGNILIQWGRYTSGINKDQSISVTYPQPFSAVANPVATPYKHGDAYIYTTIISESLTGCTIRVSGSWAQGVFWIAIGY